MFSRLVESIRRHHVFSSVWSEAAWMKDLPALERGVLEATDRDELLLALRHLSIDHVVEPSWPDAEYRRRLLHAAVKALSG